MAPPDPTAPTTTPNPNHHATHLAAAQPLFALLGRTAVVTGGTKGIGAACTVELAALGCRVLFCARTATDIESCEREWRAMGYDVQGVAADVSKPEGVRAVAEQAAAFCRGGGASNDNTTSSPQLDVLVLNAGTNVQLPTVEYDLPRHYEEIVGTNLGAPIALAQALHPLLTAAQGGGAGGGGDGAENDNNAAPSSVVLVSSVAGGPLAGRSGLLYGASKAALNHVARLLAAEWGGGARQPAGDGTTPPPPLPPRRVRVNAVAPWVTLTDMGMQNLARDPSAEARLLERTPLGRLAAPGDVASAVAWLASPKLSSYVTGQVLAVDGGYSVKGYW
jgi:Tropinone reductase 1